VSAVLNTTITLLRRFDQPIEILPSPDVRAGPDSLGVVARPAAGLLEKFKEADLLYTVDLPTGYEIRPADWRPLIDDRHALELLILELVIQNVAPARFEPISTTLLRRLDSTLRLALARRDPRVRCRYRQLRTLTRRSPGRPLNRERRPQKRRPPPSRDSYSLVRLKPADERASIPRRQTLRPRCVARRQEVTPPLSPTDDL